MCTLVILSRPGEAWPLLVAANRDERLDRVADAPGAWWADRPGVVGGRDRLGGGTWLAVRRDGMMAAVLNRSDSLGPAPGMASRGGLPLLALEFADAAAAAAGVVREGGAYRGFNLIVADRESAWFVRGGEGLAAVAMRLADGLHMVTARDPDDRASPRTARHLPRLLGARVPAPPEWGGWAAIMADRSGGPQTQINVAPIGGFGTVSASRVGVPRAGAVVFEHADGAPDRGQWRRVAWDGFRGGEVGDEAGGYPVSGGRGGTKVGG